MRPKIKSRCAMIFSTIVQRNEEGLNQIYEAACDFEALNVLEGILACKFDLKKVKQTLCYVREYQNRLNIESMDLAEFGEHFIENYATDHNECFRTAERLLRKNGTTITGSMKVFRAFCKRNHSRVLGVGKVCSALDHTLLSSRKYHDMFFGSDPYAEEVQTLLHELNTFFHHLVATLALCKEMIRKEELVRGDFTLLKEIFEHSCEQVSHGLRDVFDTFGNVKLVSDEELAERRKNARPMKEWLARDYHAHDLKWLKHEAIVRRLTSGSSYGLDEKASVLWADNPEWGRRVCSVIGKLDSLGIPFKASKKASLMGKKGAFESREMVFLVKWSGVSHVAADGKTVVDEDKEKQFYLYLQSRYTGEFLFPTWQAVCRERKFLYDTKVPVQEMVDNFARRLPQQHEVA